MILINENLNESKKVENNSFKHKYPIDLMATHQKKHIKNKGIRDFIEKEPGEEFAFIETPQGGAPPRFICRGIGEKQINAYLKNGLASGPKRIRVIKGDLVLLEKDPTTTEKEKYIIIWKYTEEEKKKLAKLGQLANLAPVNGGGGGVIFEGEGGGEEEEKEIEIDDL